MRILIIGSGGREHALAWKISQNKDVSELYIAPGNGGTALLGTNVDMSVDDIPKIVAFSKEKQIDLVVVGPELPLVLGVTNALQTEGIACFGPDAYSAQLEGSKAFAKTIMHEAGVPTAEFVVFDDSDQAKDHLETADYPLVIKADGLAAGKGVIIAPDKQTAMQTIDDMMTKKVFGTAGERVVIEEALVGEEASFLAFCDGDHVLPLPSSQDHKPIGENDTGPNTGGMGAYSPAPVLPDDQFEEISKLTMDPVINLLKAKGHPFKGVLYAGLMMTDEGPKVLEYNVRFGDPECQPLVFRLDTDLVDIMQACVDGSLSTMSMAISPETSICIVMSAEGYPGSYPKGMEINGLDQAEEIPGVKVFHAGTQKQGDKILSSGGRILGVTALGKDLKEAQKKAYDAVQKITFEQSYYRRDIGDKGIRRLGL